MLEDLWAHPQALFLPLLWIAPVLFWLVPGWILWKFYQALARIGSELAEIKVILRDRPTAPSP
jgi:hypothetical protein